MGSQLNDEQLIWQDRTNNCFQLKVCCLLCNMRGGLYSELIPQALNDMISWLPEESKNDGRAMIIALPVIKAVMKSEP